ncbi:MAG: peptidylprolyl isomerase, partial [Anderseniella sp.]|nr:peptidylprolyl isomerase [Anderseniella sp.]
MSRTSNARRVLADPLVQFLGLGAVVFVLYSGFSPAAGTPENTEITVPAAQIAQLSAVFERTWKRPPTAVELSNMVDGFVREEMYVREAIAMGLEANDSVIRRRLQQKIEFLTDAKAERLSPSEADLEAFMAQNADSYRLEERVAFTQVFLGAAASAGEPVVSETLALLEADPHRDLSELGTSTMLPPRLSLSTLTYVARTFGSGFAQDVANLPVGTWSGPVASSFGMHLVRIDDKVEAILP